MFKKKSLKFTYEKVSRDLRQAETLRARENSRFERLSMVRSLKDSDYLEKSMETPKENKLKAPEIQKPSRLEMLFKWKQEKKVKKEMEKISKKKPFYTGGNKIVMENKTALQSFKSSFIAQTNSSFNSSKFTKSKLVTPNSTVQPSKIQKPRQEIPSLTTQSSKVPSSKPTALPKIGTNLCRSNSAATISRKFPASAVNKTSTTTPTVSLTRSNNTTAVPGKFPVPSSKINKTSTAATPTVSLTRSNGATAAPRKFPVPSSKINKGLVESKTLPKRQEEKSIKKVGTGLPKMKSNITAIPKGFPVQSKMPVSHMSKKFGSNPKLDQKEASQTKENMPSRKGYCFRAAVENSSHQKVDNLSASVQGASKKLPEKISKTTQEKPSIKEFYEPSLDSIPDVTFNSDISIIKPARTSFAPANFTFRPPEGLDNFIFDDDYDVYQDLEEIKLKFMSRTSTPSKSSEGKSSIKSSKESLESSNPIANVEKTSDLSNSNDIFISELMTPNSLKVEIDNAKADKLVNKQTSNKVICDIFANIETKDANIFVDEQSCVKETEISVSAKNLPCEKIASISPAKTEFKDEKNIYQLTSQELNSEINKDLNQQAFEELSSVSPMKVVVTVANPETDVKNVDSEVQKCFIGGKQPFDDSDVTGNPEGNIVEASNIEKHFDHSIRKKIIGITSDDIAFPDDDESLLDSIDLSKMMMKSDDEDSDEDVVPSPQIPKFSERKSNGAIPKRISMLKKLSVMNSISESNETECISVIAGKSSKSQDIKSSPRRSERLSKLVDTFNYSPMKNSADSPNTTPRRSLRLMKISSHNYSASPFQEKNTYTNSRRHSVRLVDLNTPEKVACEKLLGENFENLDPNNFLIDFESPTVPAVPNSRKISLLYSPEKRKSIRKSIAGDLMSFSPV